MEVLASLLSGLKAVCAAFPDPRKGRSGNIAMADFALSAFAMFFMQSASFLSFQRTLEKGQGRSNCQTLFGIETIPSDKYIRDMLDGADPALLAPCFQRAEQLLLSARDARGVRPARRQNAHRPRRDRVFLQPEDHLPTLSDAQSAATARSKAIIACWPRPWSRRDIPRSSRSRPEIIVKQDGAEKQDCERNAVKRWLIKHGARLKPLRPAYRGDDLFACQSVVERLLDNGDDFLFTCKEASHKALLTTSSTAASSSAARSWSARARRARPTATGLSRRFRCATAQRTR